MKETFEPFHAVLKFVECIRLSYSTRYLWENCFTKEQYYMQLRPMEDVLSKGNFQEERGAIIDGKWIYYKNNGNLYIKGVFE